MVSLGNPPKNFKASLKVMSVYRIDQLGIFVDLSFFVHTFQNTCRLNMQAFWYFQKPNSQGLKFCSIKSIVSKVCAIPGYAFIPWGSGLAEACGSQLNCTALPWPWQRQQALVAAPHQPSQVLHLLQASLTDCCAHHHFAQLLWDNNNTPSEKSFWCYLLFFLYVTVRMSGLE